VSKFGTDVAQAQPHQLFLEGRHCPIFMKITQNKH